LRAGRCRTRAGRLLAIAASTALCALYASAGAPWHWVGWFAFVPWLLAQDATERPRAAMLEAWLFTAAFTGAALWWFPDVMHRYTGAPAALCWLIYLGLSPLLEPQLLAWAAARRLGGRAAGVLACVGVEWAFPKLLADTFGYGMFPSGDIRQVADLGGMPGLTLLVLGVNEALAFALRAALERRPRPAALAVALGGAAMLAAGGYGHWRRAQLASQRGSTFVAGLVQSNLTHYADMAEREGTYAVTMRILQTHGAISRKLAASEPLDLLVWPETAYPTTFGAPQSDEGVETDAEISHLVAALQVPLLFGTYDTDGTHEYNAALLLGPDGARLGTYRKARLFPLTEETPAWLEGARSWWPWLGTWKAGSGAAVLRIPLRGGGTASVAPLICYDSLDPSLAATARRLGAQALVSLSNDGWFGDTPAVELHLVSAAFRSIETRLPQARATPSGISASISAAGDILLRAEPERPSGVLAELSIANSTLTPAARWGQWPGPTSLLAAAALLARKALRAPRLRRPG